MILAIVATGFIVDDVDGVDSVMAGLFPTKKALFFFFSSLLFSSLLLSFLFSSLSLSLSHSLLQLPFPSQCCPRFLVFILCFIFMIFIFPTPSTLETR